MPVPVPDSVLLPVVVKERTVMPSAVVTVFPPETDVPVIPEIPAEIVPPVNIRLPTVITPVPPVRRFSLPLESTVKESPAKV